MRASARTRFAFLAGLAIALMLGPSALAQDEATICQIQAHGGDSPLLGQRVAVEGVVTADYVAAPLDGFFMQAPDCDADPTTSDGIWIYDGNRDAQVEEGQTVRVVGRVDEYFDLTEILLDSFEVLTDTLTTIEAVTLTLPEDPAEAAAYLEAHEGMLVDPGPLRIVGATNSYGDAYAVPAGSGIERIWRQDQEGRRIGLIFSGTWLRLRHGDRIEGAVGPLTYNYENFKIAFDDIGAIDLQRNPDLETPSVEASEPDELSIVSYNLENLFDPLDDPGKEDEDSTPSVEQYPRDIALRARSIAEMLAGPDIVAVQEVEKLAVLEDLAAHELLAGFGYQAVLEEGPDVRGIDVGYLYRAERVRLISHRQAQACTDHEDFLPDPPIACPEPGGGSGWELFSRPPLVARFEHRASGGQVTLINNHFKSKGGGDAATTPTRSRMAEHVLDLVSAERADAPEVPVLIVGDLNEFYDREPIQILTDDPGDYVNLWLDEELVAEDDRYSYIFNGVSQILDYILTPPGLEVASFGALHVNTDQGADPPWLEGGESPRASDHDPLLLTLDASALPVPAPVYEVYLPRLANGADETGGGPPTVTPTTTAPAQPTTQPNPTDDPPGPTAPAPTVTPGAGAPPRLPLRIDTIFFDGDEPRYEGDEYVEFTNASGEVVDLSGWQLISVRGDQRYAFPDGASMTAGQTCRVYTNQDHPEHCGLNWGNASQAIWSNSGDKAELRDASGRLIDWYCYGDHADQCR